MVAATRLCASQIKPKHCRTPFQSESPWASARRAPNAGAPHRYLGSVVTAKYLRRLLSKAYSLASAWQARSLAQISSMVRSLGPLSTLR